MQSIHYNDNVFINCPFDAKYKSLFDAMVFAVHDCGFIPRCALEEDDASEVRIDKIYQNLHFSKLHALAWRCRKMLSACVMELGLF